MPEVIEIHKYADFLNQKLKNTKLVDIRILKGRYKNHKPFDLYKEISKQLPLVIIDIKTKGKFLYFILENEYYIFSTLGLHGGWVWKDAEEKYDFYDMLNYVPADKQNGYYKTALNNLNVEFVNENGSMFYFDSLSFGTLKGVSGNAVLGKKLSTLGPEIMDESLTLDIFKKAFLKKKNGLIGNLLLNQKIVSGIGNYLRADALWLSKISPFRDITTLTDEDFDNLYNNLRILTWGSYDFKKGVQLGILNKSDKKSLPNHYGRDFFVYNCATDIYNNTVIKEELYTGSQKRFIYWVAKVQV